MHLHNSIIIISNAYPTVQTQPRQNTQAQMIAGSSESPPHVSYGSANFDQGQAEQHCKQIAHLAKQPVFTVFVFFMSSAS